MFIVLDSCLWDEPLLLQGGGLLQRLHSQEAEGLRSYSSGLEICVCVPFPGAGFGAHQNRFGGSGLEELPGELDWGTHKGQPCRVSLCSETSLLLVLWAGLPFPHRFTHGCEHWANLLQQERLH